MAGKGTGGISFGDSYRLYFSVIYSITCLFRGAGLEFESNRLNLIALSIRRIDTLFHSPASNFFKVAFLLLN
jgi:hypothetical protein